MHCGLVATRALIVEAFRLERGVLGSAAVGCLTANCFTKQLNLSFSPLRRTPVSPEGRAKPLARILPSCWTSTQLKNVVSST